MFLRYRATRRKFKRLRAEIVKLRSEAQALKVGKEKAEAKLEQVLNERYEREIKLLDRVLTSKGQFPVTDEVRHTVEPEREKFNEQRTYYLEKRKRELMEDAQDAGKSIAEAEEMYRRQEPYFIEEFESN